MRSTILCSKLIRKGKNIALCADIKCFSQNIIALLEDQWIRLIKVFHSPLHSKSYGAIVVKFY